MPSQFYYISISVNCPAFLPDCQIFSSLLKQSSPLHLILLLAGNFVSYFMENRDAIRRELPLAPRPTSYHLLVSVSTHPILCPITVDEISVSCSLTPFIYALDPIICPTQAYCSSNSPVSSLYHKFSLSMT